MSEHATVTETNTLHGEPLKVVLVDQSQDAQDEARDLADARLDKELSEGGKAKKFLNGIWKGNIAKDYYRQRYVTEALGSIQSASDVFVDISADKRTQALEATIERFSTEYDELIHTDAGERREIRAEDDQLARGIKHLIREFAQGRLNPATLQEERTRLLNEYRKEHGEESLGKGIVTADNLLAIAQTVVGAVEHGESLDDTLAQMQVITGEARNGARTEARYNTVDKIVDKLAKNKIGSLVTPGTLATGVAAAAAIARAGSHSVVGAATKTLLPGAAAGLWAGLRENRRMKDERAQHAREMATGGEVSEHDKRRQEIEQTRYESIPATDLIGHLQSTSNAEAFRDGGHEALQAALDALAAVQARIQLSDSKKVDLISYSSKADVGEERMMLDLARREARLAVEAELTENVRGVLGVDPSQSVKELIQQRADLFAHTLVEGEDGLSQKDKAFAKLKNRRVAKAAAVGVATGVIGGLMVQEAVAAVDPTRFGLIDALRGSTPVPYSADGQVHQTILEGFIRGHETTIHTGPSNVYDAYSTTPHGSVEVSHDHTLVTNPDGTMSLKAANGTVTVEGLKIDANGTLDQASLDKLHAAGMTVEDHSFNESITNTTSQTVSVDQYLQNHAEQATHVKRDLWYANDTPRVYDHNELRLYRGGSPDHPGIVDGGYQYTVAGMRPDGSWQGGERVDWHQAAAHGNLFVAVSGTYDSQGHPFMVPIGPDGSINIPADSPAGQFFSNEHGHVGFNGAYMEVVQSTGVDPDGVVHIRPLATLVGEANVHQLTDTVTTVTAEHHAEYVITSAGYDTVQNNFTEMAPITPIASRRSMEALVREQEPRNAAERMAYYYSGRMSERERRKILSESSPRLRENADAQLNPEEELNWYENELRRRKGDTYVQELAAFVDNDPVMKAISNSVESIVTIPVAAAYEADNIYGTLSLYAQQAPEGVSKSAILLNVNWLDTAIGDPEKFAAMQKTLAEIERARRDFPNLAISVMQREYIEAEVNKSEGVIGYVADDLVNAVLIAAQRRIAAGQMDSDHDLLIVRGDADAKGTGRNQLRNYQRVAAANKELDIVKGVTRFGVEDSVRFPGYGIISTFMSAFQVLEAHEHVIHTGGANFAIRASTLAAIGGLGDVSQYSGPGSDDVAVGRRVTAIRYNKEVVQEGAGSYSYTGGQQTKNKGIRRIQIVAGAASDTSGDRLLAAYLSGENPHGVWNSEKEKSFSDGPGRYRSRVADAEIVKNARPDVYEYDRVYASIEEVMTFELRRHSPEMGQRALSVFFGPRVGAYKITKSSNGVVFVLTDEGRQFIKNRIERETNGQFGSYGARKLRQLYGITRPNAARRPVPPSPPLVTPLS